MYDSSGYMKLIDTCGSEYQCESNLLIKCVFIQLVTL